MVRHPVCPRRGAAGRYEPARQERRSLSDFLNYLILGITRGSMYALIALGYTLVYGVLQLINFAHSEVFMSGAFGSFLAIHFLVGDGSHTSGLEAVLVVILGLVSGAA